MTQVKAEVVPVEKDMPMYKQGTKHFKAFDHKEAIYKVASFISMAQTFEEKTKTKIEDDTILEIINNSKQDLQKVESKELIKVCSAEKLQPLANLIKKTDIAIINKINKIYQAITENELLDSKNNKIKK